VIEPMPFETLVRSADLVFRGAVVRTEARWISTGNGRAIVTRVTFRVERMLKGTRQSEVTLEFVGGRIGDDELEVEGVPRFAVGQRDVICARSGDIYVSPVTGFNQGRFRVVRDNMGRDNVTAHDGRALSTISSSGSSTLFLAAAGQTAMPLAALEDEILRVQR
jgi:hypothetical protein